MPGKTSVVRVGNWLFLFLNLKYDQKCFGFEKASLAISRKNAFFQGESSSLSTALASETFPVSVHSLISYTSSKRFFPLKLINGFRQFLIHPRRFIGTSSESFGNMRVVI